MCSPFPRNTEKECQCNQVYCNWVCTQAFGESQPLLSHIYNRIIIFAPLRLGQYLDYIENVGVKSFVLVSIELLLLVFTFHCTV